MNTQRTLPILSYLVIILTSPTWTLGWLFSGICSFILYQSNPLDFWPLSFNSINALFSIIPTLLICLGFYVIYISVTEGLRFLSLLKNGELAMGLLVKLYFYGERMKNEPIYWGKYYFTTISGERYYCIGRIGLISNVDKSNVEHLMPVEGEIMGDGTAKNILDLFKEYTFPRFATLLNSEDKIPEYPAGKTPVYAQILYNKSNKKDAVPVVSIPGNFTIMPDGKLQIGKSFIPGLILPIVIIGIHYAIHHVPIHL